MGSERNQGINPPNPPCEGGSKLETVHDSLRPAIYMGWLLNSSS